MLINVTSANVQPSQASYFATVEKVYQGSDSGVTLELLPQSFSDPCFTPYSLDRYVIAHPKNEVEVRECEVLGNSEQRRTERISPMCFYIKLTMCHYFKLYTDLTPAEKQLLDQHSLV